MTTASVSLRVLLASATLSIVAGAADAEPRSQREIVSRWKSSHRAISGTAACTGRSITS